MPWLNGAAIVRLALSVGLVLAAAFSWPASTSSAGHPGGSRPIQARVHHPVHVRLRTVQLLSGGFDGGTLRPWQPGGTLRPRVIAWPPAHVRAAALVGRLDAGAAVTSTLTLSVTLPPYATAAGLAMQAWQRCTSLQPRSLLTVLVQDRAPAGRARAPTRLLSGCGRSTAWAALGANLSRSIGRTVVVTAGAVVAAHEAAALILTDVRVTATVPLTASLPPTATAGQALAVCGTAATTTVTGTAAVTTTLTDTATAFVTTTATGTTLATATRTTSARASVTTTATKTALATTTASGSATAPATTSATTSATASATALACQQQGTSATAAMTATETAAPTPTPTDVPNICVSPVISLTYAAVLPTFTPTPPPVPTRTPTITPTGTITPTPTPLWRPSPTPTTPPTVTPGPTPGYTPTPGPPAPSPTVGTTCHVVAKGISYGFVAEGPSRLTGPTLLGETNDVDSLVATGARLVRIDLHLVHSDTWTADEYAPYDAAVNAFASRGVDVLGLVGPGAVSVLYNANAWLVNSYERTGGNGDNSFLHAYAARVLDLVGHFHGRIHTWELWNEPNAGRAGVSGTYMYPSNFAAMLADTYALVKATYPDVTIVSGGILSDDDAGHSNPHNAGADYLRQVYYMGLQVTNTWQAVRRAFGTNPLDVVGQHLYLDQGGLVYTRHILDAYRWVHDAYAAFGDGAKPIYMTEGAWSTGATTPAQQALNLDMLYSMSQSPVVPYVARVYWYLLRDGQDPAQAFGLLTNDGRPKQAYYRFLAY